MEKNGEKGVVIHYRLDTGNVSVYLNLDSQNSMPEGEVLIRSNAEDYAGPSASGPETLVVRPKSS